MIIQNSAFNNSGVSSLIRLENKRLENSIMGHRQETAESYSGMWFTRQRSVVGVIPQDLLADRLPDEMPLTRLRHLQLLFVDDLLNSEVHPDATLHDLTGAFASEFLELVQSIQNSLIRDTSVESLVYREVSPTHAQRLAGSHLNGGVAA